MSKPTVLIAEDEGALVTLLRYNLEREGYRVLEARDGEEALGDRVVATVPTEGPTIRLQIGLENAEDLKADIMRGLRAAAG